MMRRQFVFLHTDEKIAFFRNDYTEAKDHQHELYIEATFPLDDEKPIENGMYVAYRDRDGNDLLFIIERPVVDLVKREVSFTASLAAMVELGDENIIEDRRPANCQAGFAVSVALEDTRWKLGTAEVTGIASNSFYYINPWAALQSISEKYPCFFRFRVTITDEGITGRYVDVLADIGRDIGLRLELYKNLDELTYDINESTVRTALYGRGKGEEVGTNSSGDATYGRRLTLADLEWSKAKGDPCDKPLGQEWIEDVEATALYGRNGRKRIDVVTFEECEDINELGRLTWEKLQSIKEPRMTVKAAVRYLEGTYGYDGEVARYGDYVTVIISDTAHVRARVTAAVIDLVDDQATQLTIGNSVLSIIDLYSQNAQDLESAKEKLSIAGGIAAKNPELFKGILNTMVTQILSTGTRMYTDPLDGSFVFETDDGDAAVKITGNGILISDEKRGDEFVWTTALNGGGMAADVINTGVLKASLVKILGTDAFYWDSQAIFIFDENDATKNRQIRIGKYDGKNYGIGYTTDGGATWQNAIGFNGVTIGAGSITAEMLASDINLDDQIARGAAPANPAVGQMWLDETNTTTGPIIKQWDGKAWASITVSSTQFAAKANSIQAIFQSIGLDGAQTGITSIGPTGLEVSHTSFGGKTAMNADGFRLYDKNGNIIGGLLNVDGEVVSAVQQLMNLRDTSFYLKVSPSIYGDGESGVELINAGVNCGAITAQFLDGDLIGIRIRSNGDLRLCTQDDVITFYEIKRAIERVRMSVNDPGGNDGDIWLEPVNPFDVS